MSSRYRVVIPSNTAHLAKRLAQPFSKRKLLYAARLIGPTLVALTFAGAAHAQGTMDFSGAQTLMGSFKTFAIYAGAVICFGGLIFAGIRMMSGRYPRTLRRAIWRRSARLGSRLDRIYRTPTTVS